MQVERIEVERTEVEWTELEWTEVERTQSMQKGPQEGEKAAGRGKGRRKGNRPQEGEKAAGRGRGRERRKKGGRARALAMEVSSTMRRLLLRSRKCLSPAAGAARVHGGCRADTERVPSGHRAQPSRAEPSLASAA